MTEPKGFPSNRLIFALIVSLVVVVLILVFADSPYHSGSVSQVTYSPMPDLPKPTLP